MWVFRLKEQQKVSHSSYFLTLTYDDIHLPRTQCGKPTLHYRDYQLFTKRLRKLEKQSKIKYYAVGEYGSETERPHYHSIIYNIRNTDNIQKAWHQGHTRVDECNLRTMAYVTKYVMKQTKFKDREDPRMREKSLMSKGLGLDYLTPQKTQYLKNQLNPYLVHTGGQKIALPRYYKEKVFTEREKVIINNKSKEHIDSLNLFENPKHEHEWKVDQYRYRDKIARLKRNKI